MKNYDYTKIEKKWPADAKAVSGRHKEYNHLKIEKKWQLKWKSDNTYKTEATSKKKKYYVLDMFPYPSGAGLHVGHPRGYIGSDVYARMKRMEGFNVLHPMGYDAFGLPAEQYAIEHKINPRKAVEINVKTFEKQLSIIGLSYDWSRKVNTTDEAYYKWTQWIFLQIYNSYYDKEKNKARPISELIKKFEKTDKDWKKLSEVEKEKILMNHRLAYEGYATVNWCPKLGTVLANDEIVDGPNGELLSERGNYPVEKKSMRQWFMRITAYADRLLTDLDELNWSLHLKEIEKNWIGRSEGSLIKFAGQEDRIEVFTTRADTLYGATFIAIHGEKDRFTGRNVTNPATNEKIPVWEAEYVMADYGTGAVMGVPAHDERDFEFAKKYNLPMKQVIEPIFIAEPNPNLPFVEREAISVVIKHWSEDKYLGLKWKKANWGTFVTGGVEVGQTPEEAALNEIREETGFLNLKLIKILPRCHSKFYHIPKKQNRFAHFHNFYFELIDGVREEISDEEKANHEIVWLFPSEVDKFLTPEGQRRDFLIIQGKENTYTGEGILINSGKFNGMESQEARKKITEAVGGKMVTKYKMRDAIFARQRYWGEPIPLKHNKDGTISVIPENKLPLKLPNVTSYTPTGTGESPLAGVPAWVKGGYETNTMPGWAGSSWYFLRYMDPKNNKNFASEKALKYWKDVDMYVGGAEHATGHLLYARFWHKFLFDMGYVPTKEPFKTLKNQGMILATDGHKMSKRWGNVINPDEIVKTYGADTLRVYEMFVGPFDQSLPWSTESIIGSRRFVEKVWRIYNTKINTKVASQKINFKGPRISRIDGSASPLSGQTISNQSFITLLHKTIKKVTEDIENFAFNTAISSMMIFLNEAEKVGNISADDFKKFLQILAPFAPHVAEELWQEMGEKKSIHLSGWPKYDKKKVVDEQIKIAIQVNGKVRAELMISREMDEEEVKAEALKDKAVIPWIENGEIKRIIYVKDRLINIVL